MSDFMCYLSAFISSSKCNTIFHKSRNFYTTVCISAPFFTRVRGRALNAEYGWEPFRRCLPAALTLAMV